MQFERRSKERLVLTRQPAGTLSVLTDRLRGRVNRISDVSETGVAVELPWFDESETAVVLEYVEGAVAVKVLGQIIWRENVARLDPGNKSIDTRLGVELFSPRLLLHVLPVAWAPESSVMQAEASAEARSAAPGRQPQHAWR